MPRTQHRSRPAEDQAEHAQRLDGGAAVGEAAVRPGSRGRSPDHTRGSAGRSAVVVVIPRRRGRRFRIGPVRGGPGRHERGGRELGAAGGAADDGPDLAVRHIELSLAFGALGDVRHGGSGFRPASWREFILMVRQRRPVCHKTRTRGGSPGPIGPMRPWVRNGNPGTEGRRAGRANHVGGGRRLDASRAGSGGARPRRRGAEPAGRRRAGARGRAVGEGWHQRYGQAHAEVNALAAAGGDARGATLYVTLEPCCHHGKTPPCTEAIVRAGVARVVAAMSDPFPEVAGKGADQLRQAGVAVEFGVGEAAARRLNAPYLTLLATRQPYVHAKWAMTLDGKIATRSGDSKWISNEASRRRVPRAARPDGRGDRRRRHGPGRRPAADRPPAGAAHRRPRRSGQPMPPTGRVRAGADGARGRPR